jgi:hypothetical protein
MDHADEPADDHDPLPDIDVLVAGTVALMTAWAQPCPTSPLPPADLRRLLARKVVSHLFFLTKHPLARPALRLSLQRAHQHWLALAQPGTGAAVTWDALVTDSVAPLLH